MVRPDASPKAGKFTGTLSRCQLSQHLRADRLDAVCAMKDAKAGKRQLGTPPGRSQPDGAPEDLS
jgi:hypothetical protein